LAALGKLAASSKRADVAYIIIIRGQLRLRKEGELGGGSVEVSPTSVKMTSRGSEGMLFFSPPSFNIAKNTQTIFS